MITLKNILVATDFQEPADAAFDYGRALARAFGATLHVFHSVENIAARALTADTFLATLPDLQRDVEASARKQLGDLLVDNDPQPLSVRPVIVTADRPAPAIVAYARDHEIDLIVMGTHGRSAIAHLLMGSVAERVVRTAPCPVLTVRHPEREFVIPDALAVVAQA